MKIRIHGVKHIFRTREALTGILFVWILFTCSPGVAAYLRVVHTSAPSVPGLDRNMSDAAQPLGMKEFVIFLCLGILTGCKAIPADARNVVAVNLSGIIAGSSWAAHAKDEKSRPCVQPDDFEPFMVVEPFDDLKHHKHRRLPIDMALVTVVSMLHSSATLCAQSNECWKCALVCVGETPDTGNWSLLVDTRFPVTLRFNHSSDFCVVNEKLEQHGHYQISLWQALSEPDQHAVLQDSQLHCNLSTDKVPPDSNIPVYIAMGILAGLSIVWMLLKFAYRKQLFRRFRLVPTVDTDRERLINSDLGSPTTSGAGAGAATDGAAASETEASDAAAPATAPVIPKETAPRKQRLQSLDTFRGLSLVVMIFVNYHGGRYWYFHHSLWNGLTVADLVFPWLSLVIMIFVNYGGGDYWYLSHSLWNGLTVADLVFPWFVFIMGTSIALAFRSQLQRGISRRMLLWKIIKRTAILFGLGIVLSNSGTGLDTVRIPGVLQRLAATYCVVALMELVFARVDDRHQDKWWSSVRDVLTFWPEWLIVIALILVQVCLTFFMPVSDCPTGYLGPGGLHNNARHQGCTGGAAGAIDRWLFTPQHMYDGPTCVTMYLDSTHYDPEGVLGTLTSIFLCFLGLQAGKVLLYHQAWGQRVIRWLIWAVITGFIAGLLCKFSQNEGWIPLNKNLWSLSFVLALGSMAFVLLTACYLLIDVFHLWSGTPFLYPGMNSILIYSCHELFEDSFPVQFHVEETHGAQLAMNIWGAALWTAVAYVLYRKKIFVAI